jgi:DNA-binding NtrC family response regulator
MAWRFRRIVGNIASRRQTPAARWKYRCSIEANKFRRDFYYRIKGYTLTIPPLREHREDIPLFAEFFLREFCTRYKKKLSFSPEALSSLTNYDWPGNIRELKMIMESVVVTTAGRRIMIEHLPLEVQQGEILTTAIKQQWTAETLLNAYIKRIMKMTGNNKTQAAKLLGWSLNKLKRLLQKMGHE